jgi:hypothetical protein
MTAPIIEMMLRDATWEAVPNVDGTTDADGIPFATHSGVWHFMGMDLRVFRLSNGQAVIHADDMTALLERMGADA